MGTGSRSRSLFRVQAHNTGEKLSNLLSDTSDNSFKNLTNYVTERVVDGRLIHPNAYSKVLAIESVNAEDIEQVSVFFVKTILPVLIKNNSIYLQCQYALKAVTNTPITTNPASNL